MRIKRTDLVTITRKMCQLTIRVPNLPLTSFIKLETDGDELIVKATDGANLLIMSCELAENCTPDEFIVDSAQFSKLLYASNTDYIELNRVNNNIQFKGNGKCLLETSTTLQPTDLKFYEVDSNDTTSGFVITKADIDDIAKYCYATVLRDFSKINIDNYLLVPNGCVSIDGDKATLIQREFEIKDRVLIPSQFLKYHSVFTQDNINFGYSTDKLVLSSSNTILVGMIFADPNVYPLQKVLSLFDENVVGTCEVNKTLLMEAIKRANIVLGGGFGGEATFKFTDNILSIQDGHKIFEEDLEVVNKTMDKTFNLSTRLLYNLLDVLNTPTVKFLFTDKTYCKIQGDGFEQMLSYSS